MEFIVRVNLLDWGWWSFGQLPEWLSVFGLGIEWVGVKELFDVVSVELEEFIGSDINSLLVVLRPLFHHF